MKLFLYVFVSLLILGGAYVLLVREVEPAAATPVTKWEAQAQIHLSTLLADQLKAAQSKDWGAFEADLKKAEAHLADAPVEADANNFRVAISAYRSQQDMRAMAPQ